MAGADDGERLVGWEMRHCFLESTCEMELGSLGSDAENAFAKAENAVGCGFEGLSNGIVRMAGDDNLRWVMSEERGGQAVGGGEEAVLGGDSGESFEGFLGEGVVAIVSGEGVDSNEGDGSDRIGAGRGGILKGLAANVEPAHGCGVGRTIEEAADFGVSVTGNGEVHRFLCGGEIARIEGGLVGVEKREDAEDLIVKRTFESGAADAMAEAAGFAPDFFQHAVEGS